MLDVSLAQSDPPSSAMDFRGLHYPRGRWSPPAGTLFPIADGVFWLRMPLPFSLDHINLWVLDDGDGWAIVDTGLNATACKDIWRALFDGPMAGRPVSRVIVTHYHPDHAGLAGWLTHKWGVPLEMTRGEFMLVRVLTLDVSEAPPASAVDFYRRAGWPKASLEALGSKGWGRFGMVVSRLPLGYKRLREGDVLTIGGRGWRIVVGSGHSPEHACLVCDELGLMIAGDQLLPRITSNVSVYPTEPMADPLGEWLESLEKLSALDAGLTVLPAHNEPFIGVRERCTQLVEDHTRKLDALEAFCVAPRTAFESFATLFTRPVGEGEIQMATGEALAHLHYLEARGRIVRIAGEGADRFVTA